jgi:DNA-binding phage protein
MGHLRPVSETTLARAKRDSEFRAALLAEALECLAENDVRTAKKMIRDYVLASMGFEALAKTVDKKPESLLRMLSEKGNPNLNNVAALLSSLKNHEGISLHVEATL